jgi:hypothetical protein
MMLQFGFVVEFGIGKISGLSFAAFQCDHRGNPAVLRGDCGKGLFININNIAEYYR